MSGIPEKLAPPPGLLTPDEIAAALRISARQIERLRVREGLPGVDLGTHRRGRRPRPLWRYDLDQVLAWARARANGGNRHGGS